LYERRRQAEGRRRDRSVGLGRELRRRGSGSGAALARGRRGRASRCGVMGPVEILYYANQQVPGSCRVDVVAPTADGQITLSNGLRLGAAPLPDLVPAPGRSR
jgi:hypothetical protein